MPESKPVSNSSLASKIGRFAPSDIVADTSKLSDNDRKALDKLIEAAKLLDPLFLRQVWSGNEALRKKLEADSSPEGRERLHVLLVLDCSSSMAYGQPDKLEFAAQLIAALGYIGMARADSVRIACLTDAPASRGFGPFGRRARLPQLVADLSPRSPRDLWHVRVAERHARPEIFKRCQELAATREPAFITYRPSHKPARSFVAILAQVRTDLDPPRVLGYSLPGRGRFDLRIDRILAIAPPPTKTEPTPS